MTEGDVVRLYLNDKGNPTLGQVMTTPIATITSDSALTDAAQRMLDSGFRHLAVVDRNNYLVGLLTEHSLMRPLELPSPVQTALQVPIELFMQRVFLR